LIEPETITVDEYKRSLQPEYNTVQIQMSSQNQLPEFDDEMRNVDGVSNSSSPADYPNLQLESSSPETTDNSTMTITKVTEQKTNTQQPSNKIVACRQINTESEPSTSKGQAKLTLSEALKRKKPKNKSNLDDADDIARKMFTTPKENSRLGGRPGIKFISLHNKIRQLVPSLCF